MHTHNSFVRSSLAAVLLGFFALSSCKKIEGEGGGSSISGKVTVIERLYVQSNFSDSIVYPGAQEDIYITYGDADTFIDDKVECSYDGSFIFKYLQPGTYTIFGYNEIFSKGSNIPNNDDDHYVLEVVKQTVELGKKEQKDLGTITLIR
jgi:hypothetical protein